MFISSQVQRNNSLDPESQSVQLLIKKADGLINGLNNVLDAGQTPGSDWPSNWQASVAHIVIQNSKGESKVEISSESIIY